MNKQGELTLNVIVMATIALLVLIVLTFIFINGAKTGREGLLSCESKEGICKSTCSDTESTAPWQCENDKGDNPDKCCTKRGTILGIEFDENS